MEFLRMSKGFLLTETGYHYYEPQIISIADDAFTGCPTSLVFHTRCETAATKWAGGKGFMVVKSEHEFETLPGKEATCTETGLTEGKKCVYCLEVTQEVIAAKGHTEVVDPAVSPTCTETGLTEGSHCSVCNAILTAQETIPAKGHTAITDPAVPATYTKTGLTEGSHCSVCGEVLIAQKTLPVLKPISIAKATITVKDKTWTGRALKPAVKVTLDGETLKKGKDYTVSYKNNTQAGTATVTVTGKGKYAGMAKGSFIINPKKVSGLKLKAGEKQLTVTWKKASGGITGYQIEYGLTKDFKGAKQVTVKKAASVEMVLKKLETGKVYYVRIRAYKKSGKKTCWSDWSKGVKSKKVK